MPMVLVLCPFRDSSMRLSTLSLHPLHRNDCNSGCGLVLVVGAGVPESKGGEIGLGSILTVTAAAAPAQATQQRRERPVGEDFAFINIGDVRCCDVCLNRRGSMSTPAWWSLEK
ncbi:hypothetical protein WMY93_023072 [Mugilogobius chulae]|uniref:Uncharacterized protein n=1 Tax=Mugilogobius chulae TaxID=88201 RepID=A0AAW0NA22_9GOBI